MNLVTYLRQIAIKPKTKRTKEEENQREDKINKNLTCDINVENSAKNVTKIFPQAITTE